jgi:cell division septation protein DedD
MIGTCSRWMDSHRVFMNRLGTKYAIVWMLSAALVALPILIGACVSSEESGSGKKYATPVATQDISESARAKVDSLRRLDSLRAKRAGFTSKHDTLVASVVRTTKFGPRLVRAIERPANPAYTVQVGAFVRTDHALLAQKLAKERFADLPIFNYFEPFDKLYRVRVGKFDTWRQADSLKKSILRKYPKEYPDCWINYISK